MRELGNLWSEGKDTQIGSYYPGMHEIHVLLVDHDSGDLVKTVNLLELCQYRVTPVELASVAISILSRGNVKFDMVMANMNSPDSHGIDLLQQAVNMDLPIILMSVDDNPIIAMRALENGAFLYIKKPTTIEMISYMWQHVLKEKTRMIRERNRLATSNYSFRGIEFNEGICPDEKHLSNIADNNMLMMKNQGKFKKKIREENSMNEDDVYNLKNVNNIRVRTKVHTVWTKELHAKFMDVVKQLGPGRCFPKEIRDLMKVDGLTRMQVASHLQKCRNDIWRIWRSLEERKSNQMTIGSSYINGFQSKIRRFGSMPRLDEGLSCYDQVQESSGAGKSPQIHAEGVLSSTDVQINMETGQIMNNTSHHQFFGSMLPGQSSVTLGTTSSTERNHPDFFIFQDMDCMIENYSTQPQESRMSNSHPPPQPYHPNPNYLKQNSFVPSMGTQIHGSLETSNFQVDESGTKDRK